MALKLGIQTYQILTNDDEVCIQSLCSIFLAVYSMYFDGVKDISSQANELWGEKQTALMCCAAG